MKRQDRRGDGYGGTRRPNTAARASPQPVRRVGTTPAALRRPRGALRRQEGGPPPTPQPG